MSKPVLQPPLATAVPGFRPFQKGDWVRLQVGDGAVGKITDVVRGAGPDGIGSLYRVDGHRGWLADWAFLPASEPFFRKLRRLCFQ